MCRRAFWKWAVLVLLPMPQGFAAQDDLRTKPHQAITRAIDFLLQAQQPDGAFRIYRCLDPALTACRAARSMGLATQTSIPSNAQTPSSLIPGSTPTAEVLRGLLAIEDPRAASMIEKGAQFLQAQMDQDGLFAYYRMVNPTLGPQCPGEFRQLRATALNRSVLETLGFSLPPILTRLATYQRPDGVFYFLAIPPAEAEAIQTGGPMQDRFRQRYGVLMRRYGVHMLKFLGIVDPVTNAEVFDYLVRHGQSSMALCDYLVQVAQQEQATANPIWADRWYLLPYTLSRAFHHGATCLEPAKAVLQPRLLRQQMSNGSWGSVLDTALAVTSLIDFGYTGEALNLAVEHLLSRQQPDGSWECAPWRVVLSPMDGEPLGWLASEEVSTGFVLQALGQYLNNIREDMTL